MRGHPEAFDSSLGVSGADLLLRERHARHHILLKRVFTELDLEHCGGVCYGRRRRQWSPVITIVPSAAPKACPCSTADALSDREAGAESTRQMTEPLA